LVLEYIRLYNEIKPKFFLLENVVMRKEHSDVISDFLGVQPVKINSANFSAQNRNRLYWTNIPILPYIPVNVTGKDITECGNPFVGCADKGKIVYEETDKSYAILARDYKGLSNFRTVAVKTETGCRKFTPLECERLQTVPDNYTNVVSDSQRIKMLGNGWTVAVIKHILKGIKE
jgi:site-specific DNA-cytosine methylase